MTQSTLAGGTGLEQAMRRLSTLDGVQITVGVQEPDGSGRKKVRDGPPSDDTLADVAYRNEYGIGVPARPWLRTALREYRTRWTRLAKPVPVAFRKRGEAAAELRLLAVAMVGDTKTTLLDYPWRENAKSTIAAKGSDQPLVDTGQLVQSQRAMVTVPGRAPEIIG